MTFLTLPKLVHLYHYLLNLFNGKHRAYSNRKSQVHSVWLTNECYISWKFKQDTWANIVWVPIDIPVGRQAKNVTYIAFCMHENIVRIPFMARKTTTKQNQKKKTSGEIGLEFTEVTSDCPVCFYIKSPYISWVVNKFHSRQVVRHTYIHK